MNRTVKYRIAAVVSAVVCLLVAWAVSAYESVRISTIDADIKTVSVSNNSAMALIDSVEKRGKAGFVAAVHDSRQEQVEFVNLIRTVADQNHVRLTRWTSATANSVSTPANISPELKAQLGAIIPSCNQIAVCGSYGELRNFLAALVKVDRLVVVGHLKWSRNAKPPDESLMFNITRFVSKI